jgi:hypothetical protein
MDELRTMISAWLDPQLVGPVIVAWSGRVFAALAIFVTGRITTTSRCAIPAEQRAFQLAVPPASK